MNRWLLCRCDLGVGGRPVDYMMRGMVVVAVWTMSGRRRCGRVSDHRGWFTYLTNGPISPGKDITKCSNRSLP